MSFFQNGSIVHQLASTATTGGTTTLVASSKQYQVFTGVSVHNVVLPDATTMQNGMVFTIINDSTGTLSIKYNDASAATTIESGKSKDFVLFDKSTSNGTFDISVNSASGGGASQSDLNLLRAGQLSSFSQTSMALAVNPEDLGGDYWTSKAPDLVVRRYVGGLAHNQYGYVWQGSTGAGTNNRYDDTNNYWLSRATIPYANNFPGSFSLNGFAFIAGGDSFVTSVYSYNDGTDAWTAVTGMPVGLGYQGCFTLGGYGFVAGGYTGTTQTAVYAYDQTANLWYTRGPLPNPQYGPGSGVVLNGFGYLCGSADNGGNLTRTVRYDIATTNWATVGALQAGASGGYKHSSASNAFIYASGGLSGGSGQTYNEQFSDTTLSWKTKAPLITGIFGSAPFSLNGNNFLVDGSQTGGGTQENFNQSYKDFNLFKTLLVKNSAAVPTNIYVLAKIKDLAFTVPAQIRTDGDSWKTVTANDSSSILKSTETLSTKFTESGLGYVTCGNDNVTGNFANTYRYNDATDAWDTRTSSGTAKQAFACFAINGASYAVAGEGPGSSIINTNEKYDEILNSYSIKTVLPASLDYCNGFALNQVGYVLGGSTGFAASTAVANTYAYSDSLNSWSSKASLGTALQNPTAVSLTGKGFHASGTNTGGSNVNTTEDYSDIANVWTSRATSISSRARTGAFSVNAMAYYFGSGASVTTNEKYDPGANSWTAVTSLNTGSYNPGSFRLGSFGYSVGGAGIATNQQYNADASIWTTKTALPANRFGSGVGFTPGIYRNYEVKIGFPAYMPGFGSGFWLTRTNLTNAERNTQGMVINGLGYVFGTTDTKGQQYNPDTNTVRFVVDSQLPTGESPGQAVLHGFGYDHALSGTIYKLNDSTFTWTTVASDRAVSNNRTSALNGFLIDVGGNDVNTTRKYNDITNAWSALATFSSSSGNYYKAPNILNGFLVMNGGNVSSFNSTNSYNDETDVWTSKTASTTEHSAPFGIVVAGEGLYAGGGLNSSIAETVVERYTQELDIWTKKPSLVQAAGFGAAWNLNGAGYAAGGLIGGTGTNLSNIQQYTSALKNILMQVAIDVTP